jgi:hypothetical protein
MCSSRNRSGSSGCGPQICAPPGGRSGGCGGAACLSGPACIAWGPGHIGYAQAEPQEEVEVKKTTAKAKA